jgi:hypothetical protein
MGILQTRIWLPQTPLSRFAPLCGTPNAGQKSGTGKSSGTRLENSSRITGHPEVIHEDGKRAARGGADLAQPCVINVVAFLDTSWWRVG